MTRRSVASRAAYRDRIHDYLRTPVWRSRSRAFRVARGFKCAACGRVSRANHAHHLTYDRAFAGKEPDSDLLCLCPPCHSAVHDYDRAHPSRTLRQNTAVAVRGIRQRCRPSRTRRVARLLLAGKVTGC